MSIKGTRADKLRTLVKDPSTLLDRASIVQKRHRTSFGVVQEARSLLEKRLSRPITHWRNIERTAMRLDRTAKKYPKLLIRVHKNSHSSLAKHYNITRQRVAQIVGILRKLAKLTQRSELVLSQQAENGNLREAVRTLVQKRMYTE